MEITLDVFQQFTRLLKSLVEIIQGPIEQNRERRKAFFAEEILPINESMKVIHEDYLKSFEELSGLLDMGSTVPRIIELLKKKRLAHVTKRRDIQAYSKVITDLKKRGYLRKRELAALYQYAEGIRNYFRGTSPVDMRVTWYSDFITDFENLVRSGKSPYEVTQFPSITTNGSPVPLVKAAFSDAVQHGLPEAWSVYSQAFQHLKLELLR